MAKRVADYFIMSDKTANAIGKGINTGSFGVRLFAYILMSIFILLILITLFGISNGFHLFSNDTLNGIVLYLLLFGLPILIPYLKELSIRHWRKKNGFSIYKDIKEEMKQAEVDKRVAMEKKAYAKHGVNQGVDKNDIGYWFNLKEQGAITEEEFLKKKKELLGLKE